MSIFAGRAQGTFIDISKISNKVFSMGVSENSNSRPVIDNIDTKRPSSKTYGFYICVFESGKENINVLWLLY